MADPFLAEIRIFTAKYAPVQWAECCGGNLPIGQYSALYAVIGINFGGDGRINFGLPNFGGCLPVGTGFAPGKLPWRIGDHQGSETVTLRASQLNHRHTMRATSEGEIKTDAEGHVLAATTGGMKLYTNASSPTVSLHNTCLTEVSGGGKAHKNVMPYLCVNYIICLEGAFPGRS